LLSIDEWCSGSENDDPTAAKLTKADLAVDRSHIDSTMRRVASSSSSTSSSEGSSSRQEEDPNITLDDHLLSSKEEVARRLAKYATNQTYVSTLTSRYDRSTTLSIQLSQSDQSRTREVDEPDVNPFRFAYVQVVVRFTHRSGEESSDHTRSDDDDREGEEDHHREFAVYRPIEEEQGEDVETLHTAAIVPTMNT
jgi:hypothetical protein